MAISVPSEDGLLQLQDGESKYLLEVQADGTLRVLDIQPIMSAGSPLPSEPYLSDKKTMAKMKARELERALAKATEAMGGVGASEPESEEMPALPELERKILPISDAVFRARLTSIMTDNKYDRKLKNRTRGKLDMTRLPKARTGSSSIFSQKASRQGKTYNVVMLVDESGSMDGQKIQVASEVSEFLALHLEGLVNLAIMGFNHFMPVHKTFEQKPPVKLREAIISRVYEDGSGCNHDYEALELAYKLFKQAPKGQNILLYLTDGEPASCGDARKNDNREAIQHLITAHAEAATVGVGIIHEPQQIKNRIVIDDLEELKPQILDILRKTIKRG